MTREQFAGVVGTNFKVILPDNAQPVWITLQAVEDLPEIVPVNPASFAVPIKQSSVAHVVPATSGFLLKFGGSTPVAQGTYLLEHDSLGQFALFVVPAGNGEQVYTAVVNRLDTPTIIAVPFATGSGAENAAKTSAPAGAVTAPAPTSTGIGNQSPDLSGSRGVQRSVLRD